MIGLARILRTVSFRRAVRVDGQPLGIDHCITLARDQRQVVARVVPASIDDDFKVHVAAGGVARGSGERDQFALLHALANLGDQF